MSIHPKDLRNALTYNRQYFDGICSPFICLKKGHLAAPHDGERAGADCIPTAIGAAIMQDKDGNYITSCTLLVQAPDYETLHKSVFHINRRIAGKPARFFYSDLWKEEYARTEDSFKVANYFLGMVPWRDVQGVDPDILVSELPADATVEQRKQVEQYRNRSEIVMIDALNPSEEDKDFSQWVSKAAIEQVNPADYRENLVPGLDHGFGRFWENILDEDGMRVAQQYLETASVAGY